MTPKAQGYFMPAEWWPHSACWMAWPCHKQTWQAIGLGRAYQAFALVANSIAEFEPVKMLINVDDLTQAKQVCSSEIEFITTELNDSWTRDTGPTFLMNAQGSLGGIDWQFNAWGENYPEYSLDTKIAKTIIDYTHAKRFQAPLIMEGGAFHTDGEGTILTTKECLLHVNRNPELTQAAIETYLLDYLNAEKIIWLNQGLAGDETDGHVDEIACFIAPGKVLALVTQDPQDENYERLQENLNLLNTTTDAKGRSIEVITLEQPPPTYLHGQRLTLSYINFYLANQGIIMPAFGYPKQDEAARALIQTLFPNHKIKQIPAIDIFAGGGGIHCITQQQPKAVMK